MRVIKSILKGFGAVALLLTALVIYEVSTMTDAEKATNIARSTLAREARAERVAEKAEVKRVAAAEKAEAKRVAAAEKARQAKIAKALNYREIVTAEFCRKLAEQKVKYPSKIDWAWGYDFYENPNRTDEGSIVSTFRQSFEAMNDFGAMLPTTVYCTTEYFPQTDRIIAIRHDFGQR